MMAEAAESSMAIKILVVKVRHPVPLKFCSALCSHLSQACAGAAQKL